MTASLDFGPVTKNFVDRLKEWNDEHGYKQDDAYYKRLAESDFHTQLAADIKNQVDKYLIEVQSKQDKKIDDLQKAVSNLAKANKKSQVHKVRNNLIIRSLDTQETSDIGKFLAERIEAGGGPRALKQLKDSIQTTEFPAREGATTNLSTYRSVLPENHKKFLFVGLAQLTKQKKGSKQTMFVENECPGYLLKRKQALEKIGYSVRQKNKKIKTKTALKGLKLKLYIKFDTNQEWIDVSDEKVADFLRSTTVLFRDNDSRKPTTPMSCMELLERSDSE